MGDNNKQEVEEYVKISLDRYDELKSKQYELDEIENILSRIKELFKGNNNFFNRKYSLKDKNNFINDIADIIGINLEDEE